jgi:hypothetical protein
MKQLVLVAAAACGHAAAAKPAAIHNVVATPSPPSWVIAPGRAIGALSLGMTVDAARSAEGLPDHTVVAGDTTALVWLGDVAKDSDGYDVHQPGYAPLHDTVVALVQGGRVVQLEASSPRFHTADGVYSTAATVDALIAALEHYGETSSWLIGSSDDGGATPASKHYVWFDDDPGLGLAVKYGAWGNLAPDPDTTAHPEAIVVHAPHQPLVPSPIDSLPYGGHAAHAYDTPLRTDWLGETPDGE